MKHTCLFVAVASALCLFGCQKEEMPQYDFFEYDQPIDLSDLLSIYDWVERGEYDPDDFDSLLMTQLIPDLPEDDTYLFEDTTFALRIPEYRDSPNPFLAQAESFYNSCAFCKNVWSNYEVWYRVYSAYEENDETITQCIDTMSVDFIADEDLRAAALRYREGLVQLLYIGPDSDEQPDLGPGDLRDAYVRVIEQKAADYLFFENQEAFVDSLRKMKDIALTLAEGKLRRYQKDKEHQVRIMLEELASCQNFDEQCSLWQLWANCPPPLDDEDRWIAAVGCRLMNSGRYSPVMDDVWTMWRAMVQMFFGQSRDSYIPNQYYNEYRKTCYVSCLRHIERFPNDNYAMNSAAVLYGYHNLLRYGIFPYGNDGYVEYMQQLGQRFKKEEE